MKIYVFYFWAFVVVDLVEYVCVCVHECVSV